jgi:hypothetical protein
MKTTILAIFCTLSGMLNAQQVGDSTYLPPILVPEYEAAEGPVVFIDEGHHNFHTKEGRYKAFATLLERDGYNVRPYIDTFTPDKLAKGEILVISNALNEKNVENWFVPTYSAFSDTEIQVLKQWVLDGGSLFLIADHMPMGGAAKKLAAAFNFKFTDGFAMEAKTEGKRGYFSRKNKSLEENSITNGRRESERVQEVTSFTGQAFTIPVYAQPILVLDEKYTNKLPDTAWVFTEKTRTHPVTGWSQGAYAYYGKGRIVCFGEAAMFTAQLGGKEGRKFGMNREEAKENYQLLLNIIHWLDGNF